MFIYVARPIDQAASTPLTPLWLPEVMATILKRLREAGVGAFLPHSAYGGAVDTDRHARFIDRINCEALANADALIAFLPSGMPSLGVPVEIETALAALKPVVVITDILYSVQLSSWRDQGVEVINLSDPDQDLPNASYLRSLLTGNSGSEPDKRVLPTKLDRGALPLTRSHHTDAGLDLATLTATTLPSGVRTLLHTGVRTAIPAGWYGRITGRSSALSRWSVQVHEGIIDAGYTGELMIGATYLGDGSLDVEAGTRLAQLILAPVWDGEVEIVNELPITLRGENGWGSSGR